MGRLPLVLTLGLGALAGVARSQAIIGNGNVILGVGAAGFLNIPYAATEGELFSLPADDPADPNGLFTPTIGLRNGAGDITALEKGTPSEGWGCGIRNGGPGSDFLDECAAESDFDGLVDGSLFNVQVAEFDADDGLIDASSSVLCGASELLYIRHQFRPANRRGCSGAYEIKVTIENRACEPVADVIYRRVLDWDIDPTPFSELLTIAGVGVDPFFEFVTNDGFCSPRPSDDCDNDFGFDGNDVEDFGPFDQGATFQINIGQLEFGERAIFRMFYGYFATEEEALQCVDGGNMNLFSLGQDEQQENTFLFGFRRSLSKVVVDSDSFQCVAAASGATTEPEATTFEVAEDALGELTPPGSPPPDVAFATVTLDDTPTDDGSDGLPTEDEKRARQGAPPAGSSAPSPSTATPSTATATAPTVA